MSIVRLPAGVLKFANGKTELFEMFVDYYNQYCAEQRGEKGLSYITKNGKGESVTFSEKEEKVNQAMMREIMARAGVKDLSEMPLEAWSTHPMLRWASFAVVNQMIDAVLPDAILRSTGMYSDVKVIGYGDSATFDIEARDLFVVSKAGRAMRQGEVKKQFKGQVAIIPENRLISVGVSLYRVLAGQESLARFASKAAMSLEAQIAKDAYTAFATAMAALDNAGDDALRFSGWSDSTFISLAQKVSAWNGGAPVTLVGTKLALQEVLPSADVNYRYDLESEYVRMGYIRNFKGVDVLEIPQQADWATEFKLTIDDTKLWVLSPAAGKLVKVVLEGSTIAMTDNAMENANLTQNANLMKSWGTGIATSSIAGTIELA